MSELILSQPDPGENRQVSAENVTAVTFDFPTEDVTLDIVGANLVIEFDNGGQIVIQGVLEQEPSGLPELHIQDGTVLSMRELLHNMQYNPIVGPYDEEGFQPLPEAGPHALLPVTPILSGDGLIDDLIGGLPGAGRFPEPPAAGPELFPDALAFDSGQAGTWPPACDDGHIQHSAHDSHCAADDELRRLYVALQLNADKL